MARRNWLLGGILALALGAASAGIVVAQQGGGSGDQPSFLDRVAAKLGIDTPKLQQAIHDARTDEINDALARGDITQEQADKLKHRADEHPGAPFDRPFAPKHGADRFGLGLDLPGLGLGAAQDKLAGFLGISSDQLAQELRADDATVANVAAAHGKSRDDLKAFIHDQAKVELDDQVTDGHLTQDQSDALLKKIDEHVDKLIDLPVGKFLGGHHFPFRPRAPDADKTPASGLGSRAPALRS